MRLKLLYWAAALALALTGCNTLPENPKAPDVTTVKVPVPVKCAGAIPSRPKLITDDELYALSAGEFVTQLSLDRMVRDIYIIDLETALSGCK